jgi:hypothetical protein
MRRAGMLPPQIHAVLAADQTSRRLYNAEMDARTAVLAQAIVAAKGVIARVKAHLGDEQISRRGIEETIRRSAFLSELLQEVRADRLDEIANTVLQEAVEGDRAAMQLVLQTEVFVRHTTADALLPYKQAFEEERRKVLATLGLQGTLLDAR